MSVLYLMACSVYPSAIKNGKNLRTNYVKMYIIGGRWGEGPHEVGRRRVQIYGVGPVCIIPEYKSLYIKCKSVLEFVHDSFALRKWKIFTSVIFRQNCSIFVYSIYVATQDISLNLVVIGQ